MKNTVSVFFVLFILLVLSTVASAQTIDTLWTKTYLLNDFDSANCVQETSDSGFIIAGGTWVSTETDQDVFLVKTDSLGNVEWSKEIGGEYHETAFHVLQTHDGGYLVSANSYAIHNTGGGIWIIRTDNVGDTLWTLTFLPEDRGGFPLYATQTYDSMYAITGLINLSGTFNDAFILIVDDDGVIQDYNSFGDSFNQDGRFITQMPDSGFIVCGWETNTYTTGDDFRAFRTNKYLTILWDSTYALTDYSDAIYGACRIDDGIVMVGQMRGAGHALKIDFDGNRVWSKSISQYATAERNTSACPTFDGGILVGGWVSVAGHRRDYSFIKLNDTGQVVSTFTVGGTEDDHAQFIIPTYDSNYAMVGLSYSFEGGSCSYLAKVTEIYNTPVGTDIQVMLDSGVTVKYGGVNTEGETTVAVDSDGPPLPGAFSTVPSEPMTYYNLTTTALYDGAIEICMEYDPLNVLSDEADLSLQHYTGADWEDITTSVDTLNNIICGVSTTLSPFIIAQPTPTGIEENQDLIPDEYALSQNYPNPFNPMTEISFSLPVRSDVSLIIYNLLGQEVKNLLQTSKPAGSYTITWDGTDNTGQQAGTGIYLYRLFAGDYTLSKKMLLLK